MSSPEPAPADGGGFVAAPAAADAPDAEAVGSWWRRLALGVVLVAVSFALDPWAWWILRNGTAYDHWAEMRELLVAAKYGTGRNGTLNR